MSWQELLLSHDERVDEAVRNGMDVGEVLSRRDIPCSFVGHPAMSGLFFNADAPADYRAWVHSDYTFYDILAPNLHDVGVLVEPDSPEPWFLSEAHDEDCLAETVTRFEQAVDVTLEQQQAHIR